MTEKKKAGLNTAVIIVLAAVGGLLAMVAVGGVMAALLIPKLADTREKARMASCVVNLRNLHLACVGFAEEAGRFPGAGAAEPGVEGFQELVRKGQLTDLRSLICPSSIDSWSAVPGLSGNGIVIPERREQVAARIAIDKRGGTCSYLMTNRDIEPSSPGALPLIIEVRHAEHGGHPAGAHVLTHDGAIEFVKSHERYQDARSKMAR